MAFRADESAKNGYKRVMEYLVFRNIPSVEKKRSQNMLADIIDKYGPVVDSYPSWHPLISGNEDTRYRAMTPEPRCGYHGLDHTVYFSNGFISCPYGDGQKIMDSVEKRYYDPLATIKAERLDVQFYSSDATPIFVQCVWAAPMGLNGLIPKSLAVPLMLETEFPGWRGASYAETWETMRSYILGTPSGNRSSLFVNQETGQSLKKIYNALIYTGMFGPIIV